VDREVRRVQRQRRRRQDESEVRHVQRQRRRRPDESEGSRPTTPNSAFSMSLPNTPQLTPRTRRRTEIRDRNPPESPRRRREPQLRGVPQRPTPLIARRPLDPNVDVRHSFKGAFEVEYVFFLGFII
jgi:hypothetical protein